MNNEHTVYVFVRQDISEAQEHIQPLHAMSRATLRFAQHEGVEDPKICFVAMPDRKALERVQRKLNENGISAYYWSDPDMPELGLTAIVTAPLNEDQKQPMKNYRLWLPRSTESRRAGCATSQTT